ncbi:MAG: methylenetetrahydrofolate reductase [NAD(P)H] [Candidatus Omnitrophica bacterium]|nr:methylenetetrahydrofolate reductase [NAD(P)H] [Candidatus Omnitrophota bacterium]
MKIRDLYKAKKWTLSFEFFPPKKPEDETRLEETFAMLKPLRPSFASITYGAMGTTRAKTIELAVSVKEKLGTESIAHLTCVSVTRPEMDGILDNLKERGIENLLALRGDPPQGEKEFKRPANGFGYACELVEYIKSRPKYDFSIGVAGYPGGHPECENPELDLKNLKCKVDCGADFIITQLFFINEIFYDFVTSCRKIGISVPIIPGIMPVLSLKQLDIFGSGGVKIPPKMYADVQNLGDDKKAIVQYGIDYATKQCEDLLRNKVAGFHIYTLNRHRAARAIYDNLNLKARIS